MRFWKELIGLLSVVTFAKDRSSEKLHTELDQILFPEQLLLQSQAQLDPGFAIGWFKARAEVIREQSLHDQENIIRSEAEAEKQFKLFETDTETETDTCNKIDKYIHRECTLGMMDLVERFLSDEVLKRNVLACFKIFCSNTKELEEPALPLSNNTCDATEPKQEEQAPGSKPEL